MRNPRRPCGAMDDPHGARKKQEYILMKTASAKSARTMASQVAVRVVGAYERLEGVKAQRKVGHASTSAI